MTDVTDLSKLPTLDALGKDRFKLLLHGDAGTGKSTLAGSVAEKCKTLFIDLPGEKGLDSLEGVSYAKNVTPFRPDGVAEMDDVFWTLQTGDHDFEAVVIESISAWHALYVRFYDGHEEGKPRKKMRGKEAPKKRDGRQVYGDANDALKDDLIFWFGLADSTATKPVHIIMTSQSRTRETREDSGDWRLGADVSPGALKIAHATPNFIGYTFIEQTEDSSLTEEEADPEDFKYCVRFGPHDEIVTKTHESLAAAKRWPAVVGRDGKQLTLPKMMRFLGYLPKK